MMNNTLPSPAVTAMPAAAQRVIKRALTLLEHQLREPGATFTSTTTAKDWLRLKMGGLEREVFMVLYLDNQHRLLDSEILFKGSINSTEVHPREVVKAVLRRNAAAVIFAHNHPSGETMPSESDKRTTQRLQAALTLVDVRILDHLVIGNTAAFSFAEHGLL